MVMDAKQQKIEDMLAAARKVIAPLLEGKKTGDYSVTLELSLNQGGIRSAYISSKARETI